MVRFLEISISLVYVIIMLRGNVGGYYVRKEEVLLRIRVIEDYLELHGGEYCTGLNLSMLMEWKALNLTLSEHTQ